MASVKGFLLNTFPYQILGPGLCDMMPEKFREKDHFQFPGFYKRELFKPMANHNMV